MAAIDWVGGHGDRLYALTKTADLWLYDLGNQRAHKLATEGLGRSHFVLSPDGQYLAGWWTGAEEVKTYEIKPSALEVIGKSFAPGLEAMSFEGENLLLASADTSWQFNLSTRIRKTSDQSPGDYHGFKAPYFDRSARHWVDPSHKVSYFVEGRLIGAWGETPVRRMSYPDVICAATVHHSDGALLLANRFGEIWQLPPFSQLEEEEGE